MQHPVLSSYPNSGPVNTYTYARAYYVTLNRFGFCVSLPEFIIRLYSEFCLRKKRCGTVDFFSVSYKIYLKDPNRLYLDFKLIIIDNSQFLYT